MGKFVTPFVHENMETILVSTWHSGVKISVAKVYSSLETALKNGHSCTVLHHALRLEQRALSVGKLHGCRALFIIVRHVVDPRAHGIAAPWLRNGRVDGLL
jgi:hypothetical protein